MEKKKEAETSKAWNEVRNKKKNSMTRKVETENYPGCQTRKGLTLFHVAGKRRNNQATTRCSVD